MLGLGLGRHKTNHMQSKDGAAWVCFLKLENRFNAMLLQYKWKQNKKDLVFHTYGIETHRTALESRSISTCAECYHQNTRKGAYQKKENKKQMSKWNSTTQISCYEQLQHNI